MHKTTAYYRRETISLTELERLKVALVHDLENYRIGIRGYSPEKMAKYGAPYMAELQAKVAEVERLIAAKSKV